MGSNSSQPQVEPKSEQPTPAPAPSMEPRQNAVQSPSPELTLPALFTTPYEADDELPVMRARQSATSVNGTAPGTTSGAASTVPVACPLLDRKALEKELLESGEFEPWELVIMRTLDLRTHVCAWRERALAAERERKRDHSARKSRSPGRERRTGPLQKVSQKFSEEQQSWEADAVAKRRRPREHSPEEPRVNRTPKPRKPPARAASPDSPGSVRQRTNKEGKGRPSSLQVLMEHALKRAGVKVRLPAPSTEPESRKRKPSRKAAVFTPVEPSVREDSLSELSDELESVQATEASAVTEANQGNEASQPWTQHLLHQLVQPSVVQPSVVQPSVVQPNVVQPSVVQPNVVQPSAVQPSVNGAPNAMSSWAHGLPSQPCHKPTSEHVPWEASALAGPPVAEPTAADPSLLAAPSSVALTVPPVSAPPHHMHSPRSPRRPRSPHSAHSPHSPHSPHGTPKALEAVEVTHGGSVKQQFVELCQAKRALLLETAQRMAALEPAFATLKVHPEWQKQHANGEGSLEKVHEHHERWLKVVSQALEEEAQHMDQEVARVSSTR